MTKTALILGASGKIGRHFGDALRASGWTTRDYTRGTDMTLAAQGCDLIVNGLNPPKYHDWANILPAITEQVLAATKASGATILFPGNVYVYGNQPGPWDADTPHRPCSKKGEIRAQVEARYRAAAEDGVQTIILRAGDFMTPEVSDTVMDTVHLSGLAKGKITTLGDPDVKRAQAWMPDLARAAAMLADKRSELPTFCDVPFEGLTLSVNDLAKALGRDTGRTLTVKRFPWWVMRVASPVWELARELVEMRYLYETPHRLSPTVLRELVPDYRPTPFEQIIAEIVERRGVAIRNR